MDYSQWKATFRSPGTLKLDSDNPRLPDMIERRSQSELIAELVKEYDVLEIADSIATQGYFPTEPIIAVVEDGYHVILEGNRRLAACKLLISPDAAPLEFRRKAKSLSCRANLQGLKKIPVFVSPTREAAEPIIVARHTAVQISKWSPVMQGKFYSRCLARGQTIERTAADFNITASHIRDTILQHDLYELACKSSLDLAALEKVRDHRNFPITTLTRIFESPNGRNFFGVDVTSTGNIKGKISPKEFEKGFVPLVTKIAMGKLTSRSLNTNAEIRKQLEMMGGSRRPDLSKEGVFNSATFNLKEPAEMPVTPPAAKPKPKQKASKGSRGLIPSDFVCGSKDERINELFEELKELPVSEFPSSAAFLLRCLVELSVYDLLHRCGGIATLRAEEKARLEAKGKKLRNDWSPELRTMLLHIPKLGDVLTDPQIPRSLPTIVRDELDFLNLSVHNRTYHPNETNVRHCWSQLSNLLKETLAK